MILARSQPLRSSRLAGPSRRRAVRDGLVVAGLIFCAYIFLVAAPVVRTFGYDAYAYWAVDLERLYRVPLGHPGFFPYSPFLAQVASVFDGLSLPHFLWLWTAFLLANVVFLGRGRTLAYLAFPPVAFELYHGNIHLPMAVATVLGFRYPAAWAFILLAKVTPGIGLLWFAVRREWRSLSIAVAATAILVGASFLLAPHLWNEWLTVLATNRQGTCGSMSCFAIPLWVRLPAAALVVAWGARTDRRWSVPVGATLALPILWVAGFSMLIAAATLAAADHVEKEGAPPARRFHLWNLSREAQVAGRVTAARSFVARLRGLMFRPTLSQDEGLWLAGTNSIHMLFMRFPIDCLFLGKPDASQARVVVGVRHALPPWRGVVWYERGADSVVELPAGTLQRSGTQVGDRVRFTGPGAGG